MEQIEAIQSLVDEHKEEMPTGVVTDLMKQCQEAFNRKSKLYKLTWVHVKAVAADVFDDECEYDRTLKVMAIPQMQMSLAEVKGPHRVVSGEKGLYPHQGLIDKDWLTESMPMVLTGQDKEWVTIVHRIEPYNIGDTTVGHKRARGAAAP